MWVQDASGVNTVALIAGAFKDADQKNDNLMFQCDWSKLMMIGQLTQEAIRGVNAGDLSVDVMVI